MFLFTHKSTWAQVCLLSTLMFIPPVSGQNSSGLVNFLLTAQRAIASQALPPESSACLNSMRDAVALVQKVEHEIKAGTVVCQRHKTLHANVQKLSMLNPCLTRQPAFFQKKLLHLRLSASKVAQSLCHCDAHPCAYGDKELMSNLSVLTQLLTDSILVKNTNLDAIKLLTSAWCKRSSYRFFSCSVLAALSSLVCAALYVRQIMVNKKVHKLLQQRDTSTPEKKATAVQSTQTDEMLFDVRQVAEMIERGQNDVHQHYHHILNQQDQPEPPQVVSIQTLMHNLATQLKVEKKDKGLFKRVLNAERRQLNSLKGIEDIKGINSIEKLNLSFNELTAIPEYLAAVVPNLKRLDISNNKLVHIPRFLATSFTHLRDIYAEDNPLDYTPAQLEELEQFFNNHGIKLHHSYEDESSDS